jgi:hypothetical protein
MRHACCRRVSRDRGSVRRFDAAGAKAGRGDKATKKVDVLDCYHPDFAAPMSFGAEPGIEFVAEAKCSGYRRIAP